MEQNLAHLELYEKLRSVPQEAQKKITGGRLSGFTDINPMWRIKMLTQEFGMCGVGWYYDILREWVEQGANGEISAFVKINLFVRIGGEWSKPIQGIGGSAFVAKEKSGLYTSDEAYKMALTDAISVSCKALGMGADIYFEKDRTKYTGNPPKDSTEYTNSPKDPYNPEEVKKRISACATEEELQKDWTKHPELQANKEYVDLINNALKRIRQ